MTAHPAALNILASGVIAGAAAHTDYVRADGISHSYGDRRVLIDVSLTVAPGRRIGLIGENGAGKSTLLRLLAGVERADSGVIQRPARTGILWQEVPFEPTDTVGELIEHAIADVRAIEAELDAAAAALAEPDAGTSAGGAAGAADAASRAAADERYDLALANAERAEVWSLDARRDELLHGLGVGGIEFERPLGQVSGGQRSRIALAALLLSRPDALLLDEPTNHLDDDAASFLERQLLAWRGPVIFASHDRAFLDAVATSLLDLDPSRGPVGKGGVGRPGETSAGAMTAFGSAARTADDPEPVGAYTAYLQAKADERARWERQFAEEQVELKRLKHSAEVTARNISFSGPPRDNDKFASGFKGGTLQKQIRRRVKDAQGRLEDLRESQVRKPPAVLSFSGIPSGSHALDEAAGTLLQLTDARIVGRLDVARFRVEPTTRVLITGPNGAGKSTLLTALAGTLPVQGGAVGRRKGLRVGLLEQDVRFADPRETPRRIYERVVGERRAEQVPLTTLGLIAPRDLDRPVGSLSIGQQRRLALALIIARPPHVFLLDEPTNHLSLSLATELEDALGSYPGAVVVASHDRWLRRRWNGEHVQMREGRLRAA